MALRGTALEGTRPPPARALLESFDAGFFNRATLSPEIHRQAGWQRVTSENIGNI